jgi:hypothetical protein
LGTSFGVIARFQAVPQLLVVRRHRAFDFYLQVFLAGGDFSPAGFFGAEHLSFAGFERRKIFSPKIGERFLLDDF